MQRERSHCEARTRSATVDLAESKWSCWKEFRRNIMTILGKRYKTAARRHGDSSLRLLDHFPTKEPMNQQYCLSLTFSFLFLLSATGFPAQFSLTSSRRTRAQRPTKHVVFAVPFHQQKESVIQSVGNSLVTARECVSKAACILPNWYSSKEGLTGESPAVFGAAGTALVQAGESLLLSNKNGIESCTCDLFVTACALEPIGLDASVEAVAGALEKSITQSDNENDCLLEAAVALEEAASEFDEYGKALDAEEHQSDHAEKQQADSCNLLPQACEWPQLFSGQVDPNMIAASWVLVLALAIRLVESLFANAMEIM